MTTAAAGEPDSNNPTDAPAPRRGRVWPAVALLAAMALTRAVPLALEQAPAWVWMVAAFGPAICGGLLLLWWLVASGAPMRARLLALAAFVVAFFVTVFALHPTMVGPGILLMTIPLGVGLFGLGAVLFRDSAPGTRALVAVALAAVGMASSTLVRSNGMWGGFALDTDWRWAPTSDAVVLGEGQARGGGEVDADALRRALEDPAWPGFRGPGRDSREHGSNPATDWQANPPERLWTINVGPGWSSFAVAGDLLFTQEQRGDEELVVCYNADTGQEVWTRAFEARFDDPLGGPGPRSTPTLADGGLFVMGATGLLARLNPADGEVVWQRDLKKDAEREPPMWGFSSSPLVIDDLVVVYAGGAGQHGVLAYDTATGEPAWSAPAGEMSYSSPQAATLLGDEYVLSLSETGLDLLSPATGEAALRYEWPISGYRSVQPQTLGEDRVLIPCADGVRMIKLTRTDTGLSAEELWTSRGLRPDFNDLVVYKGNAYGFSNKIFSSIDLETGGLNWKGGRYGKGQVLLLEDAGLLLVMGEEGEVVLLRADPTELVELARLPAIEGKTWNHPVVVGDRLYVRNSEQAAAFTLPQAGE